MTPPYKPVKPHISPCIYDCDKREQTGLLTYSIVMQRWKGFSWHPESLPEIAITKCDGETGFHYWNIIVEYSVFKLKNGSFPGT